VVRLPHLLALLCGFAVALAVGCGDRSNLIPSSRASELTQQLSALQASIDAGQCDGLSDRVKTFHDDATSLGGSIDKRLRTRINEGAASLQEHAVSDCQAAADAAQQTDTQPTEAAPPDTQTDTTTTETQTDTVPTDTTTDTVPTDTTPTTTDTVPTETTPTTPGTDTGTTPQDSTGGTSPDGGLETP
jgi:type II secretory pathway pseudopilin PulG